MPAKPPTQPVEQRGLVCPKCGCGHSFVVYTRRVTGGKVLRCRECRHCGRRLYTHEQVAY